MTTVATEKHTCERETGTFYTGTRFCGKPARFHEPKYGDSYNQLQWYCGIHAPSQKTRRRAIRVEAAAVRDAPRRAAQRRQVAIRSAEAKVITAAKAWYRAGYGDVRTGNLQAVLAYIKDLVELEAIEEAPP